MFLHLFPLTKNSPPGPYDHPYPPDRGKLLILPGAVLLPVERDQATYGTLWQFEQKRDLAEMEDWNIRLTLCSKWFSRKIF